MERETNTYSIVVSHTLAIQHHILPPSDLFHFQFDFHFESMRSETCASVID